MGISDIENAFHRMRMPVWLSEFFCLPFAYTAGELGVNAKMLNGKMLRNRDEAFVGGSNLPVGFAWSLYFAQRIFRV